MDVLFADKPAGVTTHTSNADAAGVLREVNDGFCEHLGARTGAKFLVSHRLDRDTTGCIVFACTPEAAERLRAEFAERRVKKRYLFLSDCPAKHHEFASESFIERRGSRFVSETGSSSPNARTRFRLLEESDGLYLWEALPETGKPHQIRLHAESAGIPILGDREHGGAPFTTLCLHSESIEIGDLKATSPAPRWFYRRELARDPLLARWLAAIDRRERLLRSWSACGDLTMAAEGERTLRWLHTEADPLRADQYGGFYWLSWFRERAPSPEELTAVERLAEILGWKDWALQLRADRGRTAENPIIRSRGQRPRSWQARESKLVFELRDGQGLSPGLFLDQRRNRAWVQAHANGKNVLNLFCYTGGFSVAAASGGANKVVSVDLSKTFLEWSKANFANNGITTDGHEFRAIDSREYLAWARKKGLKFDLVLCDPPSFSRSAKGIFKIEKDLEELLHAITAVAKPGGQILFASNYEGWEVEDFENRLAAFARADGRLSLEPTPSPDWDFELPGSGRIMKSALLSLSR